MSNLTESYKNASPEIKKQIYLQIENYTKIDIEGKI